MAVSQYVRNYGGYVWTNHALERLRYRRIAQSDVVSAMSRPDKTFPAKKEGSVKFIRTINGRTIHAVAAQNDRKQWVVLSVWVRGEEDRMKFPEKYVYMFVVWVGRKIGKMFGKSKGRKRNRV